MKEAHALYVIVSAGFATEVVDIARSKGATGATIVNARGSATKPQTILGITVDYEKEIVLSIVEKEVAKNIMEAVKESLGSNTEARGICFSLPVEMTTVNFGE